MAKRLRADQRLIDRRAQLILRNPQRSETPRRFRGCLWLVNGYALPIGGFFLGRHRRHLLCSLTSVLIIIGHEPGWRNWQTRMVEGHVPVREWRFKPSPGHSDWCGRMYTRDGAVRLAIN